jgi:hypothetical protein
MSRQSSDIIPPNSGALFQAIVRSRADAITRIPVGGVHHLHATLCPSGTGHDTAANVIIPVAGFGHGCDRHHSPHQIALRYLAGSRSRAHRCRAWRRLPQNHARKADVRRRFIGVFRRAHDIDKRVRSQATTVFNCQILAGRARFIITGRSIRLPDARAVELRRGLCFRIAKERRCQITPDHTPCRIGRIRAAVIGIVRSRHINSPESGVRRSGQTRPGKHRSPLGHS